MILSWPCPSASASGRTSYNFRCWRDAGYSPLSMQSTKRVGPARPPFLFMADPGRVASYQCISACRMVPSTRRTVAMPFRFRQRPRPYCLSKRGSSRMRFEVAIVWVVVESLGGVARGEWPLYAARIVAPQEAWWARDSSLRPAMIDFLRVRVPLGVWRITCQNGWLGRLAVPPTEPGPCPRFRVSSASLSTCTFAIMSRRISTLAMGRPWRGFASRRLVCWVAAFRPDPWRWQSSGLAYTKPNCSRIGTDFGRSVVRFESRPWSSLCIPASSGSRSFLPTPCT